MLSIRTASLRQLTRAHTVRLMRSSSTSTSGKNDSSAQSPSLDAKPTSDDSDSKSSTTTGKKTMAQLDEELRLKMAGLAGDGGEAGVELEDGQPVSMKRSVKNNMFRYI
jgi:hypothetical protein